MTITVPICTQRGVHIETAFTRTEEGVRAEARSWHGELPDRVMTFRFAAGVGTCDYTFPGGRIDQREVHAYRDLIIESIAHAESMSLYIQRFRATPNDVIRIENLSPQLSHMSKEMLMLLVSIRSPDTPADTVNYILSRIVKTKAFGSLISVSSVRGLDASELSFLHDLVLDAAGNDESITRLDPADAIVWVVSNQFEAAV